MVPAPRYRRSDPGQFLSYYDIKTNNLDYLVSIPSLHPDVEAIPKEPGDEFLKGHPAALVPRSDTSSWHPDLVIHIPPIEGRDPSNGSMRMEKSEAQIVNGMRRDSSNGESFFRHL
jgi:hypothetical protein